MAVKNASGNYARIVPGSGLNLKLFDFVGWEDC